MLGLNDRVPLREPVADKTDKPADKDSGKDGRAKGDAKSDGKGAAKQLPKPEAAKPEADTELPPDDAAGADREESTLPQRPL